MYTSNSVGLVKLLDKMCKYEMDPTSIVGDTEHFEKPQIAII